MERTPDASYLGAVYRTSFIDRVDERFASTFRNLRSIPEFWSVSGRAYSKEDLELHNKPVKRVKAEASMPIESVILKH